MVAPELEDELDSLKKTLEEAEDKGPGVTLPVGELGRGGVEN